MLNFLENVDQFFDNFPQTKKIIKLHSIFHLDHRLEKIMQAKTPLGKLGNKTYLLFEIKH